MRSVLVVLFVLTACVTTQAPAATPVPLVATEVAAPAAKTWDAVIDVFAERNIPILSMDRSSGFVSTDALVVRKYSGGRLAQCGTVLGVRIAPSRATYSIVVRGDSARSTVKATVRWTAGGAPDEIPLRECTSSGTWEAEVQGAIKARAEASASDRE